MRASALAMVCFVAVFATSSAAAQGLNSDRVRDTSLGRSSRIEGGAAFGLRHDHSFALKDPGVRREDVYALGTIRWSLVKRYLVLGAYTGWQDVGRASKSSDATEYNLYGSPELSLFALMSVKFGEFALRLGMLRSFTDACRDDRKPDECAVTLQVAAKGTRTRPIDFIQLLPATWGARSSLHYRIDYGLLFAQLDAGYDRRSRVAGASQEIEAGHITRLGISIGVGGPRFGLTYDMANVWAQSKLLPDAEARAAFASRISRNDGWAMANTHSFALQWYSRHWTWYAGITFMSSHKEATALNVGLDRAF